MNVRTGAALAAVALALTLAAAHTAVPTSSSRPAAPAAPGAQSAADQIASRALRPTGSTDSPGADAVGGAAAAARSGAAAGRPTVVVGIADTGVNPYHKAFHRPRNTAHPCTWVKGFDDCTIPALNLSIGTHRDHRAAVAADRAVWASVKPHQWYWIPKTNIIGAVCDVLARDNVYETVMGGDAPPACILDEGYHGTAAAASVISEAPEALLLVHEGNSGANDMPTAPVTPDIQSHSWGTALQYAPTPLQVLRPVADDPCPDGRARPETLLFLAAGNEVPSPSLLDCARARPEVQVVGGGYPGYWQANSWTVYDFASWYCRPSASHTSVDREESYCGTSFSAPTAAGAAAAALLRIREHDRFAGRSTPVRVSPSVTRTQFVDALRSAASYKPRAKFPDHVPCPDPTGPCFGKSRATTGWAPLPSQAPHLAWGYGWLDSTIVDGIVACALRRGCPAKPVDARSYNEQRQQAREAAGLQVLAPERADDAGSGRDAGADPRTLVPIIPRQAYTARLAQTLDYEDGYTFRAAAGQKLTVMRSASLAGTAPAAPPDACWIVLAPDGKRLDGTGNALAACDVGAATPSGVRLPQMGAYTLLYKSNVPHDYKFSVVLAR